MAGEELREQWGLAGVSLLAASMVVAEIQSLNRLLDDAAGE
jgi:hypothetical protein